MASQTPGAVSKRAGTQQSETKDAVVESPKRILCRVCRTGVLKLYMCGPRLRGRCRACGTVFVFLWSCYRQGWFQWSNERGKHV